MTSFSQVYESLHAQVHLARVDRRAARRRYPSLRWSPPPVLPGRARCHRPRHRPFRRSSRCKSCRSLARSRPCVNFSPRSGPRRRERHRDCRDWLTGRCANRAHRDLGARRAQSDPAHRGSHCSSTPSSRMRSCSALRRSFQARPSPSPQRTACSCGRGHSTQLKSRH